jgi:hypothetical protein
MFKNLTAAIKLLSSVASHQRDLLIVVLSTVIGLSKAWATAATLAPSQRFVFDLIIKVITTVFDIEDEVPVPGTGGYKLGRLLEAIGPWIKAKIGDRDFAQWEPIIKSIAATFVALANAAGWFKK